MLRILNFLGYDKLDIEKKFRTSYKLRNAHIDYKREVGRQNRLIQKSPLLKREGRAAEYTQNTSNQVGNANQTVSNFNKPQ